MPTARTEITEIVTGMATMGFPDVARALEVRPRNFLNVDDTHYADLSTWFGSGQYDAEFTRAWENGVAFATAAVGRVERQPTTSRV